MIHLFTNLKQKSKQKKTLLPKGLHVHLLGTDSEKGTNREREWIPYG